MDIMEFVGFVEIVWGVGGAVVGAFFGRWKWPMEVVVSASDKPRFLLTWKRGRMEGDDSAKISRKIVDLRNANQPYEYFMDGKQIHPRQR